MTTASADGRLVVIDASLALKWQFEDEEDSQQALALRDDFLVRQRIRVFAPTLYVYEVVNGITSAIRRRRLDRLQGEAAVTSLFLAQVTLQMPPIERVYELALDHDLSAYDSSYVALAEVLAADFWTADRKLYDAVRENLLWVHWLADYVASE